MTATPIKEIESFYPAGKLQWRKWLQKNHEKKQSVWLIFHKMKTGLRTLSWSEAVDEALCFGWIDSKAMPVDEDRYMQFFSKRKPKGTWSKINKETIQKLIEGGKMSQAGLDSIEMAKQNGSWTILDDVEELLIPKDLEKAFKAHKGSKQFYFSLSRSVRKHMLQWLVLARRPETRQKRILALVESLAQKQKPKQF
ncbi:MAG: YdeI/OmpD-associated family protein [Ginsengibacter sp.]